MFPNHNAVTVPIASSAFKPPAIGMTRMRPLIALGCTPILPAKAAARQEPSRTLHGVDRAGKMFLSGQNLSQQRDKFALKLLAAGPCVGYVCVVFNSDADSVRVKFQ